MENGGTAIPSGIGAGGRVYVTSLGAAKPGGTGPIRIDFSMPQNALSSAGKPEWYQVFQPAQSTPVYNVQIHPSPFRDEVNHERHFCLHPRWNPCTQSRSQ